MSRKINANMTAAERMPRPGGPQDPPLTPQELLEQDFLDLVEANPWVAFMERYPATLSFVDTSGQACDFRPYCLFTWKQYWCRGRKPLLVDLVSRSVVCGEWANWRRRIRAARDLAAQRGWDFELRHEGNVQTPALRSVRLLKPYGERTVPPEMATRLLHRLRRHKVSTPQALLTAICTKVPVRDHHTRETYAAILCHHMALGTIGYDPYEPLTRNTVIWSTWP